MRKILRITALVLIGILIAALCALLALYIIPLTETENKTAVDGSADWMAALDDSLPISEVILPGTHDSATKYVQLAFFSKCQAKDIGGQLDAGYRYLDIRLGMDGQEAPTLMHGFASCKTGALPWSDRLYLDRVLEQCYAFLQSHPTETVLFAVKHEHGAANAADVEAVMRSYTAQQPDAWLLTDRIPTVGEARGKLVLLRRYPDAAGLGAESGLPLTWVDRPESDDVSRSAVKVDNGSYTLWVQDRFKYGNDDKWAAFTAGMAAGKTGRDALSLNFLSTNGTASYGHPYSHAKVLNDRLGGLPQTELKGWIIVDFAAAPLAAHIYGANYR